MARIHKPTDFADLLKQYGLEVIELAGLCKAVDDKSRYLHWDDFRRYSTWPGMTPKPT